MQFRMGITRIRVVLLGVAVWVGLAGLGGGSSTSVSAGSLPVVRVGPLRVLVQSHNAQDPFLAINQTGQYLLTWPGLQQLGPFFRVEGGVSSDCRSLGRPCGMAAAWTSIRCWQRWGLMVSGR